MKHSTRFFRGHDCIRFECINGSDKCIPKEGGSHGISGMSILFISKGDKGAVQFVLGTGWLPQYSEQSSIGVRSVDLTTAKPYPSDLGYHSKTQQYDGQSTIDDSCEYCDGEPCYYDGSGLNANDAMYALVNGGDEGLWEFLDAYYECVFEDKAYPTPTEYEKDRRG